MKQNKEKGALIVEASIVFPVMFLVIFFMIVLGNAYYQRSRAEAIVNKYAIAGAAYCADPQLKYVSEGGVEAISGTEAYPYRFFTESVGDGIAGEIGTQIQKEIYALGTGLFSAMEPENVTAVADYSSSFLYATFSVDASYSIMIPVRMLGADEFEFMKVNTHVEVPVSDTTELIRNVDMIWDYMERTGLAESVNAASAKLSEALGKVNAWFGS